MPSWAEMPDHQRVPSLPSSSLPTSRQLSVWVEVAETRKRKKRKQKGGEYGVSNKPIIR